MAHTEEYDPLHPSQTLKLFGHKKAEQTLLNAYNSERLHHAWLISGEKGLGKSTLSYIFSRFLLTRPDEADGGGLFGEELAPEKASSLDVAADHPMMARLLSGGHGNIRVVARKYDEKKKKVPKDIGVDQVRSLVNFFNKTAAERGWRIAIIDSVDELTRNAANALLKMLEEPPERSILLLISHTPGRLLPTILSRCQKLPLLKLSDDEVLSVLKERFTELDEDEAVAIAKMADGSPGRAIEYASNNGLEVYKDMVGFLAQVPNLKTHTLHKFADSLNVIKNEALFEVFCAHYPSWLGMVARHIAAGDEFSSIVEGEEQVAARFAKTMGVERLIEETIYAQELISQTLGLHLDKKQTILSLFGNLNASFKKSEIAK